MSAFYTFVHMLKKIKQQLELLKRQPSAFGGSLMTTRRGRQGRRPLATKSTMHMVLRSTKAVGDWSFRKPKHAAKITGIINKFAAKYGVKVLSLANVGNHLHLHLKLSKRQTYKPFVRAITAAIAMAVTGASRWQKAKAKFWDYRPYTRIVEGLKAFLTLKDYIEINQWEGQGYSRERARLFIVEKEFRRKGFWSTA